MNIPALPMIPVVIAAIACGGGERPQQEKPPETPAATEEDKVPTDPETGEQAGKRDGYLAETEHRPALILVRGAEAALLGEAAKFKDERSPSFATPQRAVSLSSYWIARTEVTQSQFTVVMGANSAAGPSSDSDTCSGSGVGDNLPVICVTWSEATKYCNRLSRSEGLAPAYRTVDGRPTPKKDAEGYRLPSQIEWEYAARGGEDTLFPGTSDENEICNFANVASQLAACDDEHKGVAPVGSYQSNGYGLFDMAGNATEWLSDMRYSGSHRAVAGGGYDMHPTQMNRVFAVSAGGIKERQASQGFRVVRSARQH